MNCTRCQVVSRLPDSPERIVLFSSVPHLLAKTRTIAATFGAIERDCVEDLAVFDFSPGGWQPFLQELACRTSAAERRDIRLTPIALEETDKFGLVRAAFSAPTADHWCAHLEHGWLLNLVEKRELFSHYQPIVDVRTRSIHAHEALVRGNGADGELLNGGQIIQAARKLDMLFQVDQQARTSAIRDAPASIGAEKLFINFLPSVIYDAALCLSTTWRALSSSALKPEQIVFEIVESESIAETQDLLDVLKHYRERGFRIALDDLGSGYSSLNLLSQLRPDYVKLDIELVRHAPTDPLRAGMLDAITRLAHEHGIEVVAEGIETAEQARFIEDLGVHLMQGYFFARPARRPEVNPEALQTIGASQRHLSRVPARVA